MKGRKVELTPKQEAWLRKHFPNTKNAELMEKLGIGDGTLHRYARKMGLTKTRQFMKKIHKEISEAAKASHLANGTYPPKGYRIPRSEEFWLKPGESIRDRIGTRRWNRARKKAAETWKQTYREEHARAWFGVPQKTKLRVTSQPRQKICDRSYLKRRGYILDEQNLVAYWTPETHRATRLEARPRRYYIFKELDHEMA